jgi:soluble lytic murein transglycosylase-like protein
VTPKTPTALTVSVVFATLVALSSSRGFAQPPPVGDGGKPLDMRALFQTVGTMYAIDPALLEAIARVESGGRGDAVSSAGAAGMMQLMPKTASRFGVANRSDPVESALGAARFLNFLRYRSPARTRLADLIAAYNAGPGTIARWHGIPPYAETRSYVRRVLRAYLEGAPIPLRRGSLPAEMQALAVSPDDDALSRLAAIRRERSAALRPSQKKIPLPIP